ncbi:MAG: ABC transporter transmembrane domain-containing protein, partial [Capsulimonadaceae bacterium]
MPTRKRRPPNLHRAGRRDAIEEARARRVDEYVRNPRRERESIIRFLAYLKPNAGFFGVATLCGMTNYTLQAVAPSITGYIIDRILNVGGPAAKHRSANPLYPVIDRFLERAAPGASMVHRADILLGVLILCFVLIGGVIFLRGWLTNVGGTRVIFKLRNDLYTHIQGLSLSYFHQNQSGSIVSRLTSDISLAQNFVGNACTLLWMDSMAVIGVVFWLFRLDRPMALVSLAVLPFWSLCVHYYGTRIRAASHAVQDGMSELSGQVQEKVSGATVVKAFTREKLERLRFHRLHRSLFDRQIETVRFQALNMA